MKNMRADQALMSQYNLDSIELARALIMEGRAFEGDRRINAVSELVKAEAKLRIKGEIDKYASRGAYKLKGALEKFGIDINGLICVDIGASTGGFTDIMLRSGARRVYAVDVGYNLLDYRLRADPRVTVMERVNARFIKPDSFDERPEFGATDVSFISLRTVLPSVFEAMAVKASFVALIKPQFEAPRDRVGTGGIVRDPQVYQDVLDDIVNFIPGLGWDVLKLGVSPITGAEGNVEFLLYAVRSSGKAKISEDVDIATTVQQGYDIFIKSQNKA